MFRNFLAKFKRKRASSSGHDKDKKIKLLKEWSSKTGIKWCEMEDLVFWRDPRVSLAVFIVATGFFWKFISSKLQKFGLLIIAAAVPCSFPETRSYIVQNCQLNIDPEKRNLGFHANDVYEFAADCWVKFEQHYEYLLGLKHNDVAKFYLIVSSYITLLTIVITYFPLAGILYLATTLLYFYPILTYLDLLNICVARSQMLTHRFCLHWSHSRTKRHRDCLRKPVTMHARHPSDIENEEFIPVNVKECEKVLDEGIYRKLSSEDDDLDEFQVCDEFQEISEVGSSSSNDEESFFPSCDNGRHEMPSIGQFD